MTKYSAKYMDHPPKRRHWFRIAAVIAAAAAALGAVCFFLMNGQPVELIGQVTVEAGEPLPLAQAFLPEGTEGEISYVSDLSEIPDNVPGEYPVTLSLRRKTYTARIRIVDTVAPQGAVQDLTVLQVNMPSAADFVTQTQDVTEVTASFEQEPDANLDGEQEVVILLTDAGGNVTRLQASLTVIIDNEAPMISGVQDFLLYQGDTVAYRSGVTVTDNVDTKPQLTVDSSRVDLTTPGEYTAYYIANDASGNVSSAEAAVTVLEKKDTYVELEVVYETADELLATIIKDGMTDREKAIAVYRWVRRYCGYEDFSNKDDWRQAGYQMIETRRGDCYSYFAYCKLMLERLGIPNIDVVKVPNFEGDSMHYWSLVSVDGGETYYHLDATPRFGDDVEFLLVTDAFLDRYSKNHDDCFNRDKSLYPATP